MSNTVNVVDSIMGSGKTTAMIRYINESSPDRRFIFCTPYLEQVERIRANCIGRNFVEPSDKGMLFFYRDGFDHKVSHLLQTAENVVRRNGVKTLIFDNMTSVDLENNDNDKYIRQEEFIRNVVEFSKRWQVCCIVVLHPRKMQAVQRMGLFDLQGVTAAINLAHRVLSLYRVSQREKEGEMGRNGTWYRKPVPYDVIIDILKDRFGSASGKEVGLFYDVPSRRFFDTAETLDHRYAWDDKDYSGIPLPFGIPQFEAASEVFGEVPV